MNIRSRSDWGARAPRSRTLIPTPSRELWLHHGASSNEYGPGQTASILRAYQAYHMDKRGWVDIGYSFAVDHYGQVFECRGAGVQGSHTGGRNKVSHGIVAVGNFDVREPTGRMLDAIAELVRHGHAQGWWPAQLSGGHRDTNSSTACPGRFLYARIGDINRGEEDDMTAEQEAKLDRALEEIERVRVLIHAKTGALASRLDALEEKLRSGAHGHG